jgi:hypothetical protein
MTTKRNSIGLCTMRWLAQRQLWLAWIAFGVPACGGSSSAGGQTCTLGDTRSCVGPAACPGGQRCGDDGKWGACDCGMSPSATGGNSGAGGGATDGGGGDASTGGLGASTDEPCPSVPVAMECAAPSVQPFPTPQCGGVVCTCGTSECLHFANGCSAVLPGDNTVVIRTPEHPGNNGACASCPLTPDFPGLVYGFGIIIPQPSSGYRRVTVAPPWRAGYIMVDHDGGTCGTLHTTPCSTIESVFIMTNDPEAPVRNVVIEPVSALTDCTYPPLSDQ